MAPLTKSVLAALLACAALLAPSSVSAALTKFDTEFDGKAVFLSSSLGTIGEVTAAQKDEWLTKVFNEAKAKVDAGIADGTMTVGAYVRIIDAFYTTADTKYRNFASVASSNINGGSVDMASYDPAVGASWCDFIFDTMRELAKGKADVLAYVDAENKKFEGFVTGKTAKGEIDAAFIEFLNKVNGMDATIIDKFDDKVTALAEKITTEKKSIASTKNTDSVTTTAPPTTKPTTTTETTEAPATTTASPAAIGEKNTTEEATTAPAAASKNSSTSAPTPAPTKSSAGQLMTSAVAVLSSIAVALAVSVW